jgi:hypothetical protein
MLIYNKNDTTRMTNKTEFSPTEDSEGNIHIGDNIAPPREHTLQAAWCGPQKASFLLSLILSLMSPKRW